MVGMEIICTRSLNGISVSIHLMKCVGALGLYLVMNVMSHAELFMRLSFQFIPKCSMYGIFTYIWVIFRANVGKYSIHGASGIDLQ